MKKIILSILIVVLVAAGLIIGYLEMSAEREAEAGEEEPVVAPSRVQRAAEGAVIIRLDAAAQQRLGLQTAALEPATLPAEAAAYGRVLDPAPLAALVAQIASAQAAAEAATKEHQRLQELVKSQNASAQAVEAAAAAARQDQVALEAARRQLVSRWGGAIAGQPDLPAFVQSLVARQTALVQLDLLPGPPLAASPTGARLLLNGAEHRAIAAKILGPAPEANPQAQGQSFFALAPGAGTNAGVRLVPELVVRGFLELPGPPLTGVKVPASAVVRAAGRGWVYLRRDNTTFARRPLALKHWLDDGWLATEGLKPADVVVVTGAQMLLSEELKSQIQMVD